MTIELPTPTEPSLDQLRERRDWSTTEPRGEAPDQQIAEEEVPDWLWREHWQPPLEAEGWDWNQFRSALAEGSTIETLREWVDDDASWADVIQSAELTLGADIGVPQE